MTTFTRRLPLFALATALFASVAVEPALAQGGNIPNTPGSRTPLSSESIPTPSTGDIATTRVGPGRQAVRAPRHRARRPHRAARRAPAMAPAADTGAAPR